jgi:uncharacterized protein (TIGR03083 family)
MELARRAGSIRADSDMLADAAAGHLAVTVPSCPDWTVADLVRHVLQVHRSWYRIVDERIMTPDFVDAPMPEDAVLVEEFRAGAHRFADLLARTDPESPCWTWGTSQTAGFVQRFQVQEAALHRWDAERASGDPAPLAADGATDAVALFADLLPIVTDDPPYAFTVEITDAVGGPDRVEMLSTLGLSHAGTLRGTASDVLLVLWRRLPVTAVDVAGDPAALEAALLAAAFA